MAEIAVGKFVSPFTSAEAVQQLDENEGNPFEMPDTSLFNDSLDDSFHAKALSSTIATAGKHTSGTNARPDLDDSLCFDDDDQTQLPAEQEEGENEPLKAYTSSLLMVPCANDPVEIEDQDGEVPMLPTSASDDKPEPLDQSNDANFKENGSRLDDSTDKPVQSLKSPVKASPHDNTGPSSKVVPCFGKQTKGLKPSTAKAAPATALKRASKTCTESLRSGSKKGTEVTPDSDRSDSEPKPSEQATSAMEKKGDSEIPSTDHEPTVEPEIDSPKTTSQSQKPKFTPLKAKAAGDTKTSASKSSKGEKAAEKTSSGKIGPTTAKKVEMEKRKAEQAAKKQDKEQKKMEREQKKLEREQKKVEREQMKEQKRLEQERKKAEKENQRKVPKHNSSTKGKLQQKNVKPTDEKPSAPDFELKLPTQSNHGVSNDSSKEVLDNSPSETIPSGTAEQSSIANNRGSEEDASRPCADATLGEATAVESQSEADPHTLPAENCEQSTTPESISPADEQSKESVVEREATATSESAGDTMDSTTMTDPSKITEDITKPAFKAELAKKSSPATKMEGMQPKPLKDHPIKKAVGKPGSSKKSGSKVPQKFKSKPSKALLYTPKPSKQEKRPSRQLIKDRKRKVTEVLSSGSENHESDQDYKSPEPKRQKSKPMNYSGPVWVQCDKPDCKKWRQLNDCFNPSSLPEKWECSMNPDPAFNTCSVPEEQWSDLGDSQEFVESAFIPGSIVWARMDGYPWWPAMVEEDPDEETYYEMASVHCNIPVKYHVVFFDTPVCRSWVSSSYIRHFETTDMNDSSGVNVPQKHRQGLKFGKKQAQKALSMTLKERLAQFSFSKRYRRSASRRKRTAKDAGNKDLTSDKPNAATVNPSPGSRKSIRLDNSMATTTGPEDKPKATCCDDLVGNQLPVEAMESEILERESVSMDQKMDGTRLEDAQHEE